MSTEKSTIRSKVTDPRQFGKVAVLMGGTSAEREVSLKSGTAVLNALKERGVNAIGIDADQTLLRRLLDEKYDRVFIALHGPFGEDGTLQGTLETLGLPYTGTGVLGSALGMDKMRTKYVWRGIGLPTPDFVVVTDEVSAAKAYELPLPLMVKPVCQGSSIGMSKVTRYEQLRTACQDAGKYDGGALVERWITGAEYTASILNDQPLPLIRLETSREFYDYHAKYFANDTRYHCPCGLPKEKERHYQEIALRAFQALGCAGWGRVDFMCDGEGNPWLLEVNTVPGMTDHSLVPMAARATGLSFADLCWTILESSLADGGA